MTETQIDESLSSELRASLMSGLGLCLAGANVIMQLSRLPIGHGVAESTVKSGAIYEHPIKRTRTTLGYVMVALFGTAHERSVMRNEVNRQHRFVRSKSDSAIEYDAFDPELQLWVAACMYRGLEQSVTLFHNETGSSILDMLYRHSARFATMLQVPDSMWPPDRAAFDAYWEASLQHVRMDETTRQYLHGIASLHFLPAPVRLVLGPPHRFVTIGFLPERFRNELGVPWSSYRQLGFNVFTAFVAFLNRKLPRRLREFPWNLVLWDTRRRIAHGRPVV